LVSVARTGRWFSSAPEVSESFRGFLAQFSVEPIAMAAHPLNRPASWRLTIGAPDARVVRWAGAGLWLAGAVVGIVWLLALTDDALAGHVQPIYLLLAWPAMLSWLLLARRIWRRWIVGANPLTLEWRGPVTSEQEQFQLGGFHVREWGAPAQLQVALSWQGWMLLSLSRVHGQAKGETPTYAWLDAREVDDPQATSHNRSLHQLRTLLHLPAAMTTQQAQALPDAARHGASWAHSFNPGSMLRRLLSSLLASFRDGHTTDVAAPGRPDTVFPATTLMADQRTHRPSAHARHEGPR
jgi:hypothetical protein